MKYLIYGCRFLKFIIKSCFSFGRICGGFPLKLGKNVTIQCRKGGAIKLSKCISINSSSVLAATKDAVLSIAAHSGIGHNNIIVAREKILIGSNVMLGPNVCIYDHDHNFRGRGIIRDMGFRTSPVVIEDNVWIGAGVIILKGVTIGTGSVIGAGTVLKKSVPPRSLVYNSLELKIVPRDES